MIKVVYDTNVLVSAVLKSQSFPAFLVSLALQHRVELCVSPELLKEYREVLQRPKFKLPPATVDIFIEDIQKHSRMVHPQERVVADVDAGDRHVLECAVSADAEYLVTGNIKHFPSPRFRKITILPPAAFALRFLTS